MNKKISLGAALAFMLIFAAATFSATMIFAQMNFNQKSDDLERSRKMYMKFAEVDKAVQENYSGAINETQLMDSVAQGYMKGIGDKYGAYISAEEYKKIAKSKEGEDIGIGAVLEVTPDGYLSVVEVYPESPAQVAEIAVGDIIVKVDGTNITPENAEQYIGLIQGEAGTNLDLVVRKGKEEVSIPGLIRRAVAIPSVYSRMIPETNVGYILIKQFNDNTSDQFNREFHKLLEGGADGIVFDVRDNRGSSMAAAVRIIDKLVPEGVIYSATNRDGRTEVRETSDANEILLPMAVITNANTSSAAELFAQDLKDFGKASIVGATTMGRGVLLDRIKLSDGSAIDLTTAIINSSSGVVFDGAGIKPDYEIPMTESNFSDLDENTDPQLKKAIEVVLAMRKAVVTTLAEASSSESSTPETSSTPQSIVPPTSSSDPSSSAPSSEDEPSDSEDSESGSSEDESPKDESSGGESSQSASGDLDEDEPEDEPSDGEPPSSSSSAG